MYLSRPRHINCQTSHALVYVCTPKKFCMCLGAGQCVLRPRTTDEVSEILKYCNNRNLAVVPQGGNTGLVGGSVPVFDEVVVSTQLMTQVIDVDELSGEYSVYLALHDFFNLKQVLAKKIHKILIHIRFEF